MKKITSNLQVWS